MARKKTASMSDSIGSSDRTVSDENVQVKFVCNYPEFGFSIEELDKDGNEVFHTDANGNKKLKNYKQYVFSKVTVRDPKTGKVDTRGAYSIFIVEKSVHGKDFDRMVKHLNKLMANPRNKLYDEDSHFERRNPEAYRIAKKTMELESERDSLKNKVDELERKLGFKKQ